MKKISLIVLVDSKKIPVEIENCQGKMQSKKIQKIQIFQKCKKTQQMQKFGFAFSPPPPALGPKKMGGEESSQLRLDG